MPFTGCWSCCGDEVHYGIRCESLEGGQTHPTFSPPHTRHTTNQPRYTITTAREKWAESVAQHARVTARLQQNRQAARERRDKWQQEHDDFLSHEEQRRQDLLDPGSKLDNTYWERNPKPSLAPGSCLAGPTIKQRVEMASSTVFEKALATFKVENVPMLITTMKHNRDQQFFQDQGLKTLRHLSTFEAGRAACTKHGAISAVIIAQQAHPDSEDIQSLCVEVLGNFASSVDSQQVIIDDEDCTARSLKQLRMFQHHRHIAGKLLSVIRAVSSRVTRHGFLLNQDCPDLILAILKNFEEDTMVVADGLSVFENLAGSANGRKALIRMDIVSDCVRLLKKFRATKGKHLVLQAAVGVCTYCCNEKEGCLLVLKADGLLTVLNALKNMLGAEKFQLRGMVMVRNISRLNEGWEKLQSIRGAWQWIGQGTEKGNSLVHEHEGTLQNPGWCLGDAPNPTIYDRPLEEAYSLDYKWDTQRLREYMGMKYAWQNFNLGYNIASHENYFNIVSDLGLLPFKGELREDWYARLHTYEESNNVDLKALADKQGTSITKRIETRKEIEAMFEDTSNLLNWPDSRPGSRASAGSRVGSRGNRGESLMTYTRAGSRASSRGANKGSGIGGCGTPGTAESSNARALDPLRGRQTPNGAMSTPGTAGSSSGNVKFAGFEDFYEQNTVTEKHFDSTGRELTLSMFDVSKLISMQDQRGIGMVGTRPYSREVASSTTAVSFRPGDASKAPQLLAAMPFGSTRLIPGTELCKQMKCLVQALTLASKIAWP